MRTDSVRIAGEALTEARTFIQDVYGKEFLPAKAKVYAPSEKAQDAHEAVRPSSLAYRPLEIKQYLSSDEFRLYQLIWNRFVASQMNPALYDQTTVDITAGDCLFQARGIVLNSRDSRSPTPRGKTRTMKTATERPCRSFPRRKC